ncbi:MAG: hypothetical protein NZM35_08800 [Chitinophagales bacterium]|nr:hypothetical protein [Chitinophagales bacterium]MDW8419326.1 hypothetical protein [Chitinophagales bacterium]
MKSTYLISTLIFCFTFLSFQTYELNNSGSFSATIDNRPFKVRQDQLLRGLVMYKAASMDGMVPARNVVSTTFYGPSYELEDGRPFTESIWIEIDYPNSFAAGNRYDFTVAMQYDRASYYMLPGTGKLTITNVTWDAEKKYFWLDGELTCTMRSMFYTPDTKRDFQLQCKLSKIRVTVPVWIAKG